MNKNKNAIEITSHCSRCGICCQKNSPSLHLDDLEKLQSGAIPKNQLITYRKGEWVYDNIIDQYIRLEQDMIKPIENTTNGFCTFYLPDQQSCLIYENRPLECQLQACYDPEPLKQRYETDRLQRRDIFPSNSAIWEFIEYHESKCSLSIFQHIVPFSDHHLSEKDISLFKEMIRFDYHFRFTLHKRIGLQNTEMNFILGRSVENLLKQLRVII